MLKSCMQRLVDLLQTEGESAPRKVRLVNGDSLIVGYYVHA